MRTLILSPRYTTDSRRIREAALQAGWRVERLGNWRAPERLLQRDIALYAEPLFAEVIASSLSWALLDATPDWLPLLPYAYRQREIRLTTLGEARKLSQPTFVKPAGGRKDFEATVYQHGSNLPTSDLALPDSTPVLISEPVEWEIEFRFFICERRVMTFSSYLRCGALTLLADETWKATHAEKEQAQTYMTALLADQAVPLPPAIVIDIGKIAGRGWAVIESNSAWGAGLYGCEPLEVLSVLARSCVRFEQLTPEDVPWVANKDTVIEG